MESRRFANGRAARVIAAVLITITALAPSTVAAQQVVSAPLSIAIQPDLTRPVALPDMQLPAPQLVTDTPADIPTDVPIATQAPSLSQSLVLWQTSSPSEPMVRERVEVSARTEVHRPVLTDTIRRIVLDPTTYAPAAIVYTSLHLDWRSSQPMFRAGYNEAHPGYTRSGLANDVPVGYAEGQRRNLNIALNLLGRSVANNAVTSLVERALIEKAPQHRKLIRVLGWIERTAFASYFSYVLSEQHFRQWQKNEAMARQIGAK
jgi:hypothetical protein